MNEKSQYKVMNLVGIPTDYSDKNNWAHLPENPDKEVDTFFIYPTVYINPVQAPNSSIKNRAVLTALFPI